MDEQSERKIEFKRQFSDFLDQDHGQGEYLDKIKTILTKENISKNKLRLEVDIYDLQQFNSALHQSLLADPSECIQPFEDALNDIIRNAYPKSSLQEEQAVKLAFTGDAQALTCRLHGARSPMQPYTFCIGHSSLLRRCCPSQ